MAAASATDALNAALTQLGIRYSWGAENPGQDFDCSGLVQWAYKSIGVNLPRTSQQQFSATTPIPANQAQPGDLVFSAGSDGTQNAPGHVGIYLGGGQYIDAPYTGAVVRYDAVPSDAQYGRVSGVTAGTAPNTATAGGGQAGAPYTPSSIPDIPAVPPDLPDFTLDPGNEVARLASWYAEFGGWAFFTLLVFFFGGLLFLLGTALLINILASPAVGPIVAVASTKSPTGKAAAAVSSLGSKPNQLEPAA